MNRYLHISLAAPESDLDPSKREQVREQVGEQARADAIRRLAEKPSKFVQKLLRVLKDDMIDAGLVEMTQPDSPRSPTQRYRLTAKGRETQGGAK